MKLTLFTRGAAPCRADRCRDRETTTVAPMQRFGGRSIWPSTIANGTLRLLLFGPSGDGKRQGLLMVPSRIAQALSPWLFGVLLDRWGERALWLSAGLGTTAFTALTLLWAPPVNGARRAWRPS